MIARLIKCFLTATFVVVTTLSCAVASTSDITVNAASLDLSDDNYRLLTNCSVKINHALEDMLVHGIPLYFQTQVEIRKPHSFWFDEVPVSKSRITRISYNVLTRRYTISIPGSIRRNYSSLDNALSAIRYPPGWDIAHVSALEKGETYTVSVRMLLDVSQLPKPFQVNALNNSDWNLVSDWEQFSYTP